MRPARRRRQFGFVHVKRRALYPGQCQPFGQIVEIGPVDHGVQLTGLTAQDIAELVVDTQTCHDPDPVACGVHILSPE